MRAASGVATHTKWRSAHGAGLLPYNQCLYLLRVSGRGSVRVSNRVRVRVRVRVRIRVRARLRTRLGVSWPWAVQPVRVRVPVAQAVVGGP